jgi:hypothetical protein
MPVCKEGIPFSLVPVPSDWGNNEATSNTGGRRMKNTNFSKHLLWAFLLSLPIAALYVAHFVNWAKVPGVPTGFLQYDMAYYIANARQYMDGEHTWLFYANPYDFHNSPSIYFQPLILLLGGLQFFVPTLPALSFVFLGGLCTITSFYMLSRLVEAVYQPPNDHLHALMIVTLAWGGGCLALLGTLGSLARGIQADPFFIDPEKGMWFLNLGRNFIYPTEAFYHLLVITLFLAVFRRKKYLVLGLAWILALSHPFTGFQYSLIVLGWALLESYFVNSKLFTRYEVLAYTTPVVFCVLYYLNFLPQFESHHSLMQQWSLDWSIKLPTIIGAYSLVGILALYRCRTKEKFADCFADPFNRFLGVCFLVSFILANHEALISPRQPIHFTRGHIWTPLCLLGLPVLAELWKKWRQKRFVLVLAIAGWLGLVFSDNVTFFIYKCTQPLGIYLTDSQRKLHTFLSEEAPDRPIILSENSWVGYLGAVYSPARPYWGHPFNTPDFIRKRDEATQFFQAGTIPLDLRDINFWVVTQQYSGRLQQDPRFHKIYVADEINVFEYLKQGSTSPQ